MLCSECSIADSRFLSVASQNVFALEYIAICAFEWVRRALRWPRKIGVGDIVGKGSVGGFSQHHLKAHRILLNVSGCECHSMW